MRGTILLNGNIDREADFIEAFKDRLLDSRHESPAVRRSRKVVMCTAAWKKDEYNEGHVRAALNRAGIPSHYEGGYDTNIQNLGAWHAFAEWKQREPELYAQYHAKQNVIKELKQFYRRKNVQLVALLREQGALVKRSFPEATMGRVLAYPAQARRRDLSSFSPRELQYHFCCQDVQHTLASIVENDARMVDVCDELDLSFFASSGVTQNPAWREHKKRLEERILSANSLFLFGGYVAVLANRLNFFKLKGAFVEALQRGTCFYAVSAGTAVLSRSIILYNDFADRHGGSSEFEFFDNGFGILSGVQVFPHCNDRIKTDDPENLAYLARRFQSSCCVGLNQQSFLLVEGETDSEGHLRERFTSLGDKDGVYVFDPTGRKVVRRKGEVVDAL